MTQAEVGHAVTWERFSGLFREKYLGDACLAGKVTEFMEIRQGKISVAEYTAKFDELARFASNMVPTDESRKRKYMFGLQTNTVKQIGSGKEGP